jgi:diguanylate cyclase (GGDEF)-like protein
MAPPDRPDPPTSSTIEDRDQAAEDRDRTSDAHDQASDARDMRSQARDDRAVERERQGGGADVDAAADRAGAAHDRRCSAGDRKHSETDRDAASADRVRAAAERADLVVDGLTGARHRAPGLAELEREVLKARRTGRPFVLAFLDVDGLKNINDTRGHAAGDEVLRQVVAVVKQALREYDLVIRYGGDEFVCGLPDFGLQDAADRFAETTKSLERRDVTFSVGLASLEDGDTVQDLIDRADAAMYYQRSTRTTGRDLPAAPAGGG